METTAQEISIALGPLVLVWLALILLMIASVWRVFTKAGKPGWACLVPFYNLFVMIEIAGKPAWWFLLFFIPLANLIAMILIYAGIAERFGKGGGFVVGLILLPIVFFPILGFGGARYQPPAPAAAPAA